ncbi:MAG: hypothetical protein J6U50_06915 [Lachnospiraceae bacterium]|nr:hypothetical protein [Lachnospiraceae bacterium]
MKQGAILKSYNGAMKLILDPDMDFEELLACIGDKFRESRKFLGSGSIILDIDGRKLTDEEERRILDVVGENCDADIACIVGKNEDDQEHIRKIGELLESRMDDDDKCRILHGTVMDKQVIEVDDSIIIFGDVNPGSEIRSKGSIIVLGGLYGKAYAGSYGDASAFICAIEMEAEELMIGEFTYVPESKPVWSAVLKSSPKVARVVNDEITIGPLGRVVMEKIYESKKLQAEGL